MSTVPTTNISLRELYKTMYANTDSNITNVSMDTLHGTSPAVPASGAISMSSFKSKIGQSTSISTFNGWSNTTTTFSGSGNLELVASGVAFGYMWMYVGYAGLYRSTNGLNWTQVFSSNTYAAYNFLIGNGVLKFIDKITVDGTNWVTITNDGTNHLYSHATTIDRIPSTGTLVAGIADRSTIPYTSNVGLAYSTNNGSTWTYQTSAGGITFPNGSGMLVGYWSSQGKMYATGSFAETAYNNLRFTSTDGINWTALTPGSSPGFYIGGGAPFPGSASVKFSDGSPAFVFANMNDNEVYFTDGSTFYSNGWGVSSDFTGQVNSWYVITAAGRVGSVSAGQYKYANSFWSATGQKWQPWSVPVAFGFTGFAVSRVLHIPYNGKVHCYSITSRASSMQLKYGYYDFSTVTPN